MRSFIDYCDGVLNAFPYGLIQVTCMEKHGNPIRVLWPLILFDLSSKSLTSFTDKADWICRPARMRHFPPLFLFQFLVETQLCLLVSWSMCQSMNLPVILSIKCHQLRNTQRFTAPIVSYLQLLEAR